MAHAPNHGMLAETIGWALGGGGLIALGSGLKWLWDKIAGARASREQRLEAREQSYVKKLEERLNAMDSKLADIDKENHAVLTKMNRVAQFCVLAIEELEAANPRSTLISHGRALLARDFPEIFMISPTPPDMTELAARIE